MVNRWNPYIAGGLVGLLSVVSVLVTSLLIDKPKYLGTSTTFVRVAAMIENSFNSQTVAGNEYYQKTKIKVDWQFLFVIGIFIGALGSSVVSRTFSLTYIPGIWKERFGKSVPKRALGAVIGGIIAIWGVRLAGGCPSGHGLSGMMQLAMSGLIAMAGFMGGGFITARILYKKSGGGR